VAAGSTTAAAPWPCPARKVAPGQVGRYSGPADDEVARFAGRDAYVIEESAEAAVTRRVPDMRVDRWPTPMMLVAWLLALALPGSLAPSAVAQGKLADNLYEIGTIGLTPMIQGVVVISTRLHNVPKTLGNDWPLRSPGNARPEQFFFTR
jgi:hypothetical protein